MVPDHNEVSRRCFFQQLGGAAAAVGLSATASSGLGAGSTSTAESITQAAFGRDDFLLDPDLIYLNTGSLGATPRVVMDKVFEAWQQLETDPVGQNWGPLNKEAEQVRADLAAFVGCETKEIAITRNTTEGIHQIAQGLNLTKGDRILTTDHEHGSCMAAWQYLKRYQGVEIDQVTLPVPPDSDDQVVNLFRNALTPRTQVILVSHVTHTTGLRLPIKKLAKLAEAKNLLLIVDGAQAPGMLDINLKESGCHAYASSAQKWLLAPKGLGWLYVRDGLAERIHPPMLQAGPRVYTAPVGTRNVPNIIGLGETIRYHQAIGKSKIEEHVLGLRDHLLQRLGSLPQVKVISPKDRTLASGIVSIALPKAFPAGRFVRTLREKYQIVVRVVGSKFNAIRVSMHIYNTREHVDRLVEVLKQELSSNSQ